MSYKVNFNGVDMPIFIKVKAVDITALGEPTINITKRTGGVGNIFSGFSLGSKKISMKVMILPLEETDYETRVTTIHSVPKVSRELTEWLMGDNWKPSPLTFSDDVGIYYDAIVSNSVDITDLLVAGEGTIEFIVPSGVSRGEKHSKSATLDWGTKTAVVNYQGTAPSSAYIKYHPKTHITAVDNWSMEVEETGDALYIDEFASFGENIIDCEARRISSTAGTSVENVNLNTSNWIHFPKKGVYHIKLNMSSNCDLDIQYTEYFY